MKTLLALLLLARQPTHLAPQQPDQPDHPSRDYGQRLAEVELMLAVGRAR